MPFRVSSWIASANYSNVHTDIVENYTEFGGSPCEPGLAVFEFGDFRRCAPKGGDCAYHHTLPDRYYCAPGYECVSETFGTIGEEFTYVRRCMDSATMATAGYSSCSSRHNLAECLTGPLECVGCFTPGNNSFSCVMGMFGVQHCLWNNRLPVFSDVSGRYHWASLFAPTNAYFAGYPAGEPYFFDNARQKRVLEYYRPDWDDTDVYPRCPPGTLIRKWDALSAADCEPVRVVARSRRVTCCLFFSFVCTRLHSAPHRVILFFSLTASNVQCEDDGVAAWIVKYPLYDFWSHDHGLYEVTPRCVRCWPGSVRIYKPAFTRLLHCALC